MLPGASSKREMPVTLGPQTPKPRDPRELPSLAPLTIERRWCCWSWESVVMNRQRQMDQAAAPAGRVLR
jgi:hypothetical protein